MLLLNYLIAESIRETNGFLMAAETRIVKPRPDCSKVLFSVGISISQRLAGRFYLWKHSPAPEIIYVNVTNAGTQGVSVSGLVKKLRCHLHMLQKLVSATSWLRGIIIETDVTAHVIEILYDIRIFGALGQ